jgi:hypothetical protein
MCKRMFALLALAISLFGTQCWAQENCFGEGGVSCTFSPGTTKGVYDFTGTGDGKLVVDFDIVLTTFTLTVNVSHPSDPLPLDSSVFPEGTVCVKYPSKGTQCDQYDFTGNAGGPHGVPVKNTDYKRLITLTLSYDTLQTVHNPAFGHAPGDIATFTEDILTNYFEPVFIDDPTMGGKTPGLSSVVALDEPLTENNDSFCFVSPQENQTFAVGRKIEVEFRLTNGADCHSGTPLRDKTARFSLATTDSSGNVVFPRLRNKEGGNKFHFDHKDGVNEFDLSTKGLTPGTYTITVFSSKFSPQSVDIILAPCTGDCDDDKDDD